MTNLSELPGLPIGMPVELDAATLVDMAGLVAGGSPRRVLRLNPAALKAFAELQAGYVRTTSGAKLGRRLSDAGLLHPRPERFSPSEIAELVTVVIPVRDRADDLRRCLAALVGVTEADADARSRFADEHFAAEVPHSVRLIVVDDASRAPDAIADIAARYGATLVRRDVNGGPGAARNSGLAQATTPFVAFCDSDCVPPIDWIESLFGHFADPLVAAVAPRIVASAPDSGDAEVATSGATGASGVDRISLARRFAAARSPLDLGRHPARVQAMSRVSYVPTAALIVRRTALDQLAGQPAFDELLRYGEDVDLIWRLIEADWRVRYDPTVQVAHREPQRWRSLLSRRFAYGGSAPALEDRHPDQVSPLILVASPAVTVAALLARRPAWAAVACAVGYLELAIELKRSAMPLRGAATPVARSVEETFFGVGRWTSQFIAPAAIAAMAIPIGSWRSRAWRAGVIVALLAASPIREWSRQRPPIDVASWTAAVLCDDLAYGAGVWAASIRQGHLRAVRPRVRLRLLSSRNNPRRGHR
ncbi:mycofactocin biosynthesis glycosyltransferase MftF [Jatrophihabitans sp. DSM 45814]